MEFEHFEQALGAGQSYMECGAWSAAIPFLNTAHRLAYSQLGRQSQELIDAMYDFCTVSVLLILSYKKLALITEAFDVYVHAVETVEKLDVSRQELKAECIDNINFQFPDPQVPQARPSKRIMAH